MNATCEFIKETLTGKPAVKKTMHNEESVLRLAMEALAAKQGDAPRNDHNDCADITAKDIKAILSGKYVAETKNSNVALVREALDKSKPVNKSLNFIRACMDKRVDLVDMLAQLNMFGYKTAAGKAYNVGSFVHELEMYGFLPKVPVKLERVRSGNSALTAVKEPVKKQKQEQELKVIGGGEGVTLSEILD